MTGKNKNRIKSSWRSKLFSLINGIVLTLLALLCILPLVNVLAISLSSNTAVTAGKVMFLPVDFTLKSYEYVAKREAFWRAMGITLERCLLGVALNVLLCIMTAYPLSKKNSRFHSRTAYTWFFFLTMLINGGLIPNFMTVKSLNLLGTIWALVLPGAVPVFSVVLMLNFFRHKTETTPIIKSASIIGLATILLGMLCLVLDLTNPLYFWRILVYYNPTSVMSIGVMLLLFYIPLVAVLMVMSFADTFSKWPP